MARCAQCQFDAEPGVLPGPSDHEPWCGAFMVGPAWLEGQIALELEADVVDGKTEEA